MDVESSIQTPVMLQKHRKRPLYEKRKGKHVPVQEYEELFQEQPVFFPKPLEEEIKESELTSRDVREEHRYDPIGTYLTPRMGEEYTYYSDRPVMTEQEVLAEGGKPTKQQRMLTRRERKTEDEKRMETNLHESGIIYRLMTMLYPDAKSREEQNMLKQRFFEFFKEYIQRQNWSPERLIIELRTSLEFIAEELKKWCAEHGCMRGVSASFCRRL